MPDGARGTGDSINQNSERVHSNKTLPDWLDVQDSIFQHRVGVRDEPVKMHPEDLIHGVAP